MLKSSIIVLLFAFIPAFIFAQIPSGTIARYPLNGNANDASGSGMNGALTSAANTTNRFGAVNTALLFTAATSSGTLPSALVTALQNDFSVGAWFKTSITAPTGSQWYNGTSLVDGEVGGVTNDWGICLIDGGKVCFGIGNPDITIKSTTATYNNNAWHFVTATRNKTAGTITLYVDGAQVATVGSTNTSALNAPSVIGLGRSSAVATGNYSGSLDDIIAYNRVLSATEVSNLYTALSATALPLTWLSFNATVQQNDVLLQWQTANEVNNDYFTVEAAADAVHFNAAGTTRGYSFTDKNKSGSWFYRIRQTDIDGRYSYSKTIRADIGGNTAVYIQTNPATGTLVLINPRQALIQRISITDISGKLISSKTINSYPAAVNLDITGLAAGYYLLKTGQQAIPFIKK